MLLLLAAFAPGACSNSIVAGETPRVLVSSDIGGTDPDDFQSMVHLLVPMRHSDQPPNCPTGGRMIRRRR
jgi:hypothetical protein